MADGDRRAANSGRASCASAERFDLADIDIADLRDAVVASVVPEIQPPLFAALRTFVGERLLVVDLQPGGDQG